MLRSTIFEEKKPQQITGMFVSKAFSLGYKYRGRGIRVHMNSNDFFFDPCSTCHWILHYTVKRFEDCINEIQYFE